MVRHVGLAAASLADKPVIERLMQLYLHDFSEFAPIGSPHGEIGPDGLFAYGYLDLYWREEGRWPFLTTADGNIAGFVLLNTWSARGRDDVRSVAEFFVVRKYRRAGIGSRAAAAVFAQHRGAWEVPVAAYNAPALAFWRAAIIGVTGQPAREIAGDGMRWTGPILSFETA